MLHNQKCNEHFYPSWSDKDWNKTPFHQTAYAKAPLRRCAQPGHNARTCHAVVNADIKAIENIELVGV